MSGIPFAQQRVLVRAAERDDLRVSSGNADVLMSLYAADLVARDALTPSGLALAKRLMAADASLRSAERS